MPWPNGAAVASCRSPAICRRSWPLRRRARLGWRSCRECSPARARRCSGRCCRRAARRTAWRCITWRGSTCVRCAPKSPARRPPQPRRRRQPGHITIRFTMLIVFDVDGTLIDANELDHRCFDEAFLEVTGVRLPGERWNQVREFTAQAIVREALHDWRQDERSAAEAKIRAGFLARLTAAHAANPQAFPPAAGGPALIEELAASATCR